jgi:hypothetical protein
VLTTEPATAEPIPPDERPTITAASRPPMPKRRYWLLLLLPLVLGGALRALAASSDDVITTDASAYLRSGTSIWAGDGFRREGHPELHFPPVAPTLLGGAADLLDDPLTGTTTVILVTGTLVLLPLAGIARRLGGDRAGLSAAWIGAVAPALVTVPANQGGGSENPYLFLVLAAVWSTIAVARRRDRWLYVGAATSGLCVGLAYLTRPEGIGYSAVLLPVLVVGAAGGIQAVRRGRLRALWSGRVAGVLLAFPIALAGCVVPYVDYLHTHTGRWELTAKTRDASLEAWRAVAEGDRRARDEIFYDLASEGTSFTADRFTLAELVKDDPVGYLGIVGVNVREAGTEVFGLGFHPFPSWELLPLPVTLLALFALWKRRRAWMTWVVAASAAMALVAPITFFVQPRYLTPFSALMCVLAGVGITIVPVRWKGWAVGVTAATLASSLFVGLGGPGHFLDTREQVEHRIAGQWLAEHTPEDARVMTRSLVVDFYAHRQIVPMPYSSLGRMLEFARDTGTDYIVADEYQLARQRPLFASLFLHGPWPGLHLELEFHEGGRLTRIFSLDPPAPPDDEDDLPSDVGFVGDEGGG